MRATPLAAALMMVLAGCAGTGTSDSGQTPTMGGLSSNTSTMPSKSLAPSFPLDPPTWILNESWTYRVIQKTYVNGHLYWENRTETRVVTGTTNCESVCQYEVFASLVLDNDPAEPRNHTYRISPDTLGPAEAPSGEWPGLPFPLTGASQRLGDYNHAVGAPTMMVVAGRQYGVVRDTFSRAEPQASFEKSGTRYYSPEEGWFVYQDVYDALYGAEIWQNIILVGHTAG